MSLKKFAIFLGIAVFFLGLIGTAGATLITIPDTLAIDFRNKTNWSPANGDEDFTYMRIKVKADAEDDGYLAWTEYGMGIMGGEIGDHSSDKDSRIDGADNSSNEQELQIFFPDHVRYDKLWLTGFEGDPDDLEIELDGHEISSLSALITRSDGPGDLVYIDLSGLRFERIDIEGDNPRTKFYVAGFSNTAVPLTNGVPVSEPATLLLLGVGLIGLAGFGRKKILR
jgi:hypothetical protein